MFGLTRTLIVDGLIDQGQIDPTNTEGAWALFLHTLRGALGEDSGTVLLFYHEADDVVRQLLWDPKSYRNAWVEYVPMGGEAGKQILARLRRLICVWRQPPAVRGQIRVIHRGQVRRVELFSPHAWDVRLNVTEQRPPKLPYELVFTGRQPAGRSVVP
jgi:hypothetical protein